MANMLKVGLENNALKLRVIRDAHWLLYNQYFVNTNCTLNTIFYVCTYKNPAMLLYQV